MKRWIIAFIVILIVLGGVTLIMALWPKVDMNFATKGKAIFRYEEKNIVQTISANDLTKLYVLFEGKRLYSDDLSCGFSENIAIVINESEQFYFACDSCPIVYWKNKNKFFKLSASEYDELMEILRGYGFVFPCV